jgi:site-specific recombinase XerD
LLARLGLRSLEVASLKLHDIDWHRGEIVVQAKGRCERLPLPSDVGQALTNYLYDRPRGSCRNVFLAVLAPIEGLDASGVRCVVRRACRRAGLPPFGAHRLRHTAATQMLNAGASLAEVGQVLRHHDPQTTAIYAKVDRASLRGLAQPWPRSIP